VRPEETTPYRFTGKELDAETGLYYYGARYLDPKTSRWLSADPAMGDYIPGAPVSDEARMRNGNLPGMGGIFNLVNLHVYHYAGNNPVKYVDPDGRIGIDALMNLFNASKNGDIVKINFWNNFFPSSNPGDIANHYAKANQLENPLTAIEAKRSGFRAVDPNDAAWHRQGEGNEYNLKMVHNDGREAVYSKDGNLVTDDLNLGSKNNHDYQTDGILHVTDDVLPYIPLGNTKRDSRGLIGMIERIKIIFNRPPIPEDYKTYWKDFYDE
jgi:RHS repeat-associated protein